jgi:hypothetical protein
MDLNDISRPTYYTQDSPLGYQTINKFWDWFYKAIRPAILKKHKPDGSFNTRQVAYATATYHWDQNKGSYKIAGSDDSGIFPYEVYPEDLGRIKFSFDRTISGVYDIQATAALDTDGFALVPAYTLGSVGNYGFELNFIRPVDNKGSNPLAFSVTIFAGT